MSNGTMVVPDYEPSSGPPANSDDPALQKRPPVTVSVPQNVALGLGASLVVCVVTIIVLVSGGDDGGGPAVIATDAGMTQEPADESALPHRSVQGCTTTPDAEPAFASSAGTADLSNCQVSIVGAGPGGVYSAWRLAKDGVATTGIPPERICIFERTQRVGGRIFTIRNLGPRGDLVVESGAYRFSSDGATPLLTALIQQGLQLPWVAYDSTHNKIVLDSNDPDSNAGYVTFVESMLNELTILGVRFFPLHELVKMTEPVSQKTLATRDWTRGRWQPRFELTFANGATAVSAIHISNIMQQPLFSVLQKSDLSFYNPSYGSTPERSDALNALYLPKPNTACKFYAYYEDAWWRRLNDQFGHPLTPAGLEISRSGSSGSYHEDAPDGMSMPLAGRYHDGHSKCNADGTCYGYLMMVYTSSRSGSNPCEFFEQYQVSHDPPVSTFTADTPIGDYLLKHAHQRVVNYHLSQNVTLSPTIINSPPTSAVLSLWNANAKGFGGGWDGWRQGGIDDPISTRCWRPPCTVRLHDAHAKQYVFPLELFF